MCWLPMTYTVAHIVASLGAWVGLVLEIITLTVGVMGGYYGRYHVSQQCFSAYDGRAMLRLDTQLLIGRGYTTVLSRSPFWYTKKHLE